MIIGGLLESFVLEALNEREFSGKEIINKITKSTNSHWKVSAGTVYPLLKKMEKKKLLR